MIGKEEKALIPAKIQQKKCKALIDTGASRSCKSEKNYHELQLPSLSELLVVRVTSATGTSIKYASSLKKPASSPSSKLKRYHEISPDSTIEKEYPHLIMYPNFISG